MEANNSSPKLSRRRASDESPADQESYPPPMSSYIGLADSSLLKSSSGDAEIYLPDIGGGSRPSPQGFPEVQGSQPNNKAGRNNNFVNTVTAICKEKIIYGPISIFKVPETLTSAKPEAYVPPLIGLGAIHHLRGEIQHMQTYKVMEARRLHNEFQSGIEFDDFVEFLKQIVAPSVRASYNVYLDMEDDVLACIMAVDGLFLFNLLCCYGMSNEDQVRLSSLSHRLVNSSERKLAPETAVQVATLLENQIPIFVLKVILIIECRIGTDERKIEIVSDLLPKMLLDFCKLLSPFKTIVENYPVYKALKHAHLLDLLYHLVTLKQSPERNQEEKDEELRSIKKLSEEVESEILAVLLSKTTKKSGKTFRKAIEIGLKLAPPAAQKPLQLLQGLRALPFSDTKSSIASALKEELPAKEVFIPRASELRKAGVKFSSATANHITDIKFKKKTATFELPSIRINANSEVLIRNLVVYEAMIMSEQDPPILNWYVELMNGLVQTVEDVRVLKDQKVIDESTIDDVQVVKIFSGMNKSVELTNITKDLDDAVREVKKYYNDAWWVSMCKFTKKCWRTMSKWFAVFAVFLILFLMVVQTFCFVYECPRFSFKDNHNSDAQQAALRFPSLRSHLM